MESQKTKGVWESHNVAAQVKIGGTLYVKVHAAHLRKDVTPTADTIAILMPGDEVVWQGAHETDKRFHKISFTVKNAKQSNLNRKHNPPLGSTVTGYIFGANLAVKPPDMELRSINPAGKINPVAYPSYGTSVKG